MRVAAVDIGTNTIAFLVAKEETSGLRALHDESLIVRLGEGVDQIGRLSPTAIERTLAALAHVAEIARALQVDRIGAVGTQALRETSNGGSFLARAQSLLGCPVEVISADREARLAWRALARAFPRAPAVRRTLLDIGGGSTELVVGAAQPDRLVSMPIGSVRLTERLLRHDPPTANERSALFQAIDEALDEAPCPEGELIGVAGTVTTVCTLHLGLPRYDATLVHGAHLTRAAVFELVEHLGAMPVDQRRQLPGLDPGRADVVFAGAAILARVLARSPAGEVLVSDHGVRWGLAEELLRSA